MINGLLDALLQIGQRLYITLSGTLFNLGISAAESEGAGHGPLDNPLGHFEYKSFSWAQIKIGPVDMSLSKEIIAIFLVTAVVIVLFVLAARQKGAVPRGLRNVIEMFVKWLRDDIVYKFIGKDAEVWVPFIGTVFFFILISNWLGLIPGNGAATGNINVTATLAIMVFFVFIGSGIFKYGPLGYVKSLVPKGVPAWLIPLMLPIEMVGQIAKPFSLAVRLFANIFAGHIIILCFLGIIIKFSSLVIAPGPLLGVIMMDALEIMFGFIQAYIFTILSAMYVGSALHPQH